MPLPLIQDDGGETTIVRSFRVVLETNDPHGDEDLEQFEVIVHVDLSLIAHYYAQRAYNNRNKQTRLLMEAVQVRII